MIALIATYKVRPEATEQAVAANRTFVAKVRANEPGTLLYEAFQRPDATELLNIMIFRDEAAQRAHQSSPYVMEFTSVLYPLCDEGPTFTPLRLVR